MKRIYYLLLVTGLFLNACSSDRPSRGRDGASAGGGGAAGNDSKTGDGTKDGGVSTDPLPGVVFLRGSAMRLLDGRALTIIYSRVFPPRAYGFEHCKNNRFPEITDCTESVFEPNERPFMGTIDLYTPQFSRGPQNLRQAEDLTLNYTRTLRVALSRECDAFVNREWQALQEGKEAANFLIKAQKPTKAGLEEYFRRLLGVEGTNLPVAISSDEYLQAFATYIGTKNDPETLKRGYYGLCIAVSMDPQIFIY